MYIICTCQHGTGRCPMHDPIQIGDLTTTHGAGIIWLGDKPEQKFPVGWDERDALI